MFATAGPGPSIRHAPLRHPPQPARLAPGGIGPGRGSAPASRQGRTRPRTADQRDAAKRPPDPHDLLSPGSPIPSSLVRLMVHLRPILRGITSTSPREVELAAHAGPVM